MNRSRTPSAQTLFAGSLIAGAFIFLAFVATTSTSTGCSSATPTPPPDASQPPCNEGPFTFCQVATPGQASCNTDDGASAFLTRIPKGTNYAVGCVINFVGARDEQGDCRLDAVCKCVIGERPAQPSVTPDSGAPDASDATDAGDDAEAGTSPPPEADSGTAGPTTGPVWLCDK